jgi:hypothetical protein
LWAVISSGWGLVDSLKVLVGRLGLVFGFWGSCTVDGALKSKKLLSMIFKVGPNETAGW